MSEFIPAFSFCKKKNISPQNLYRWIREGKINKNDIKYIKLTVTRLRIKENASYPKNKKTLETLPQVITKKM